MTRSNWTMKGRFLQLSAVFVALVFAALMSSEARACDPEPEGCCWEAGGKTGWLTCIDCQESANGIMLCEEFAHPPPDYWAHSKTKPLSLTTVRREYPELWRSMQARGSTRSFKMEAR